MPKDIRILLLGCGGSPGVNFIKALRLADKNVLIVGVDLGKYNLQGAPVAKKYLLERNPGEEKKYVQKIIQIIKKEKITFVHAQPDDEVKILSDYRDQIPATTFLPSKEAVDIAQDKWLTYRRLQSRGVPVARTFQLTDESSLKHVFKSIQGPIWLRASRGYGGKASLPVDEIDHAKMWISYWIKHGGLTWDDFLASEKLPGREISWLSIWKDNKLICSQQKERVSWVQGHIAPSGVGGTTAVQKTTHEKKINDVCTATILALDKNPNGIYVVDTKENTKGIPCVTEINPGRFFTTSLFFATAGVNMPNIFVRAGLNLPIPKVKQYNCLPKDIYWIRILDDDATMVKNGQWRHKTL